MGEACSVEDGGDSDIENTPETQFSLLHGGSKLNSHETATSPVNVLLKNQQKSFVSQTNNKE